MKKQAQLGVVVEGNSISSAILRFPTIAEELGPIKSSALRVARRLSNFLRAGYPVADYEELAVARLILMRVPDSIVPRIVQELCASELVFRNLSFVLCESWLMVDVLEPLRLRGASVATLVAVPTTRRDWFVVEGQIPAVRQVRRFVERNQARALEIRAGTKQLYFAAELLATVLPLPFFAIAQQALRACGISGHRLHGLLDEMVTGMFSDLLQGGRMTWGGPLTQCSTQTAGAYLEALRRSHPEIAGVVDEQLAWAKRQISKQKPAKARAASTS